MTKQESIAALQRKPVPFTTPSGLTVQLRAITVGERRALANFYREAESDPLFGERLARKYVALGLVDDAGQPLATEAEAESLPLSAVDYDAISVEVARRAGLFRTEQDEGKASSPATPS